MFCRVKLYLGARSLGGRPRTAHGGRALPLSVRCIAYYFTVRPVSAPTRYSFPRVAFLVVAGLALEHEVVRVQRDVRVVAVLIVEPDLPVMDNLARLYVAGLAQPAVYCHSFGYVSIPSTSPRLGLVELFLVDKQTPPLSAHLSHLRQRILCRHNLVLQVPF